jgi:HK97 gp10 family phage protein
VDFELRSESWFNKDEVRERVQKASIDRLAKAALLVEAEAKRSLNKGAAKVRTQSIDGKNVKNVTFESGPAGQPPRKRTGNLQNSIKTAKTPEGTYVIGPTTSAWYGRVHEFGALIKVTQKMKGYLWHAFGWHVAKPTIYIPPRPFMRPALAACKAKFAKLFENLPLGGNLDKK